MGKLPVKLVHLVELDMFDTVYFMEGVGGGGGAMISHCTQGSLWVQFAQKQHGMKICSIGFLRRLSQQLNYQTRIA